MTDIASLLKRSYPADVVDALIGAYVDIERNFALRKWKESELDAGHFVEAGRRMLEHALFGNCTPLSKKLSKFNESALKHYEGATGDDAFRILMPRALWAVYGIRNKRGVGHVGPVSPNEMDATYILYVTKWVLAEFLRQCAGLTPAETQKLVAGVVERRLSLLWKHAGVVRVLHGSLRAEEKILVLLYDADKQSDTALRSAIEYSNAARFHKILSKLHNHRLIEHQDDGVCVLTPKGTLEAEKIVRRVEQLS